MNDTKHLRLLAALLLAAALPGCGSGPHLEVPTPPSSQYASLRPLAIHAVSPQVVFVCGNLLLEDGTPEGLVLRSEDGGRRWARTAFEVRDLRRVTCQTVFFTDRLRGWVGAIRVTDEGVTRPIVLVTTDGGNHWRERVLPMAPSMIVTEIHSLSFDSEEVGTVVVQTADPETFKLTETWYGTSDGGRNWEVLDDRFRVAPAPRVATSTAAMVDKKRGFRLRPGADGGVTYVETTASGGKDWLPVHEMSLAALDTYYQGDVTYGPVQRRSRAH